MGIQGQAHAPCPFPKKHHRNENADKNGEEGKPKQRHAKEAGYAAKTDDS